MLNCKNTNVNLATVHDLIKILSPPRNLLLFYNIPPGCLGEVSSESESSHSQWNNSKVKHILNV